MRRLSYNQFLEEQGAFEQAVWSSPHLAKFCSTGAWQTAAFENLHGEHFGVVEPRGTFIIEEDGNWLVFSERNPGVFYPFEAAWMFGCPLVGDPAACLDLLHRAVKENLGQGFGFVISGVREGSELYELIGPFLKLHTVHSEEFATTDCMAIDLTEGTEAFLSRRSRSFRKSIRQMKPLEDLQYVDASSEAPENVFPRIIDLQSRSHKAASDAGDIFSEPRYKSFYRHLYESLYQAGAIKTIFAQVDGQDIAYIMGSVIRNVYRGFQMSYDQEFRTYSLGNRLQIENIERCHQQGVTHYDLGMHSEYKERWADEMEVYKGFFVVI